MKNSIKITALLIALLGMSLTAQSQQNRLIVPDVDVQYGEAQLPINVENTDEIVAAQFDLALPDGITAKLSGTLSNRGDDHTVSVKHLGGQVYRVMLHSPANRPLRGQSGAAFYLPVVIPKSLPDGSEHQPTLSKGVLGVITGENVLTDVSVGKIRISRLPDLLPSNLTCDETTIEPGQTISLSWQVANVGDLSTTGGWSEQVSLVSDDGEISKLISTTHYNELLAAGGIVSRQVSVALPTLLGIDGEATLQIRVVPYADCGEKPSAQGNNTLEGHQQLSIQKRLTFELSPTRVDENRNTRVSLKVTRSGLWTEAETFAITATSDGRAPVPAEITIPAKHASAIAYFNIVNNDVLDDDSIVNISVGGNGYAAVQQTLTVIDDEFPDLRVIASQTDVTEGESFQLTISTMRVSAYPIIVSIASENTRRFTFPATVTIPAGEESVTVTVETVEDEIPSLDLSNAFTVSASKHNKAETMVLLHDNDLPALELSITPTTVSESVGAVAIEATLRRTTNIDKKITVKLTDDSDGGLYFANRTFDLAKGVEEVNFNFGIVDNAIVDGDRTYNITAAVWISSCNCGASGESAGFSTAQLHVLDNDGAALNMSASVSTVKEGSATTLTISRNTDTSSPLTVTLTSDYSEGLTYPQTVTIPAGQRSTTVDVVSAGNDVQGDSHNVIFTVQANGHATGTCFLTITDQTKPDAVIAAIHTDANEIEVGQTVVLTVVVVNKGVAALPFNTEVKIGCSGSSEQKTLTLPADLAAGDTVTLETDYVLPVTAVGNYKLTATVNPGRYVSELNYNNNALSSANITVLPNFSATVTVDKQRYRQGETVVISGQTSAAGRNADVEVYLINNGARQSLTVKADANGHFETTYQPYNRQSGHFVVGACYPKTGETSGSAEFDVYGLLLPNVYATHDISLGDEAKGSFTIKNPGMLPQTGLQIEQLKEPNGCDLTIGEVSSIDADGEVEVSYSLNANAVSSGQDWLQVPLSITSSEGSSSTFTIYYYVRSLKAQLKASQTRIETTMTKGVARDYLLQVSNVGRGETGRLSLSLPSWIELATASEIPSLSQGDTITLALRMMPTEDMEMNVPVTGQIGINCENGNGVAVALNVTPVSEETGNLVIDVVDEYTFYAEGSPHVEGANVLVKHPTTGRVIAQGKTASNGYYSVELPEGWYTVSINADKHQGYQTTLEVAPGKDTGKQIFLTYEAISYSWDVVETEVEDEYQIETVVKFETNVPKPVIISTLPTEKPEIGGIVPVVVTNKGLIAANRVDISLTSSDGLTLEWLTNPYMEVLAPQQSSVFYAVLKEKNASARRKAPGENWGTCMSLYLDIRGHYLCGDYEEAIKESNSRAWGDCLESHFYTYGGTSGGSGGWSGGGGYYSGNRPYSLPGGTSNTYAASTWQGTPSPSAKMCHEQEIDDFSYPPVYDGRHMELDLESCEANIEGYSLYQADDDFRYVRGVAADGVSKIRIITYGSRPPTIEEAQGMQEYGLSCTQTPKWTLKENIGTLEGADTWDDVTYTAPPDFPGGPNDSVYTVTAVLHYNIHYDIDNGLTEDTYEVPIKIARAPLALIHGLASDGECWGKFAKHITTGGKKIEGMDMYRDYQVLCVDYSDTHFRHFAINEKVVDKSVKELFSRYLSNGLVAKKADLIGHSMGGILSRLHVQYVDNTNVHKLITVNTPHSGSPWGNWVSNLPSDNAISIIKDLWTGNMWHGGYDGAIRDLSIGSEATDRYLNDNYKENSTILRRMDGIPIHAVASFLKDDPDYALFYSLVTALKSGVVSDIKDILGVYKAANDIDVIEGYDYIDENMNVIHALYYMEATDFKDFLDGLESAFTIFKHWGYGMDMADALAVSDCVVPYDSQTGGLTGSQCKTFDKGGILDVSHIFITDVVPVWNHLKKLLNASVNDDMFSMNGFHPIKLEYTDQPLSRGLVTNPVPQSSGDSSSDVLLSIVGDSLFVSVSKPIGFDEETIVLMKVGENDIIKCGDNSSIEIPSTYQGNIKVYAFMQSTDGFLHCDSASVNIVSPRTIPVDIECQRISQIVVSKPQKITLLCTWADGSVTTVIPDGATFTDNLASYTEGKITGLNKGSGTATFTYQGLTCEAPITVYNFGNSDDEENSKSVCSTITLKLSQTMTMTRQAFRGTLTVFNGNENAAMRDVKLTLQVTNKETGKVATSSDFEMHAESIDGFTGEVDLTSGWTLAGNATGTATVLFIPTKYAAPTEPVEWSFGGTLSYLDPFTGLTVTRDLYPVTLTVKPSPELDLTYFMQRDVYGDDPLTMDVVEPVKPAEFALLINNKGYGDATDVKMVTQQPEIVDNQKGLAINFELISSQVNGAPATLALGKAITNNFGTIPAHSQMYAQWWLTSTLLGHFTEYDVEATHVTSYGNEDLSLLDKVTIHELIHGFDLSTNEQQLRAFLVNDLPDSEDLPDMLYFSNGETENVSIAASSVVERTSNTTCKLTIVPSAAGWNYGNLLDPTHGMATIKSIVRQSDGKEMAADNFWQTDRTLRDGKVWLYDNRLHFIDELTGTGAETYVITFNPIPNVVLEVESIEVVPEEGTVAVEPVETLAVTFSKPIEPETFTADDLTFSVQGAKQDASLIGISTADNKSFALDLKTVTEQCPNGYYTLTVQTADITDNEGYQGKTGKQVGWIMYRGGLVQLLTSAWPEKSGSVSRSTDEGAGARQAEPSEKQEDTAQYGSTVTFTAQPAEGYEFSSWTLNGEEVSREVTYTATALSDMDVVAYFTKKSYHVDIDAESENGSISGAGTGYYVYGSQLSLSAVPSEDFILKEWNVNGETVPAGNGTLNLTVNSDQTIKAVFEREYYHQSIVLAKGWNWVSSYLNESLDTEPMSKYANRIVGQFDELILDPQYGMVGGLERLSSGSAFKVEANRAFTSSFRGHLYNPEATPMQLHKGWNWIAYPYTEQLPTSTVIVNAEDGDYLVSQSGFTEFADGYWEGSLKELVPGSGYLYKSVSSKMLSFDFTSGGSTGSRSMSNRSSLSTENGDVDIYRYPNTMNMTIQIYQEDNSLSTGDYNIYAMVGDELRGVSQKIGDNYYLTVYGDEPVEVSFAVESTTTGEVFVAPETLRFRDDVVGSRKSPYVLHIGGSTGIESLAADGRPMTVYSLEGILVSRDATLKTLKKLPKGVYIVNGHKCFIK